MEIYVHSQQESFVLLEHVAKRPMLLMLIIAKSREIGVDM